jgi:hypothetical protein
MSKKETLYTRTEKAMWLYAVCCIVFGAIPLYIFYLMFAKTDAGLKIVIGSPIVAMIAMMLPSVFVKMLIVWQIAEFMGLEFDKLKSDIYDATPLAYKLPFFMIQFGPYLMARLLFIGIARLKLGDRRWRENTPYIFWGFQ